MKRIIYLALVITSMSIAKAIAQDKKILVGISGGVGYTNLSDDFSNGFYSPKINPHFGVWSDIPISARLSVGTSLNYRKKSRQLTDPYEVNNATERQEFYSKSLTLPVFMSYTIGERTKLKLGLGGFYGRILEVGYYYDALIIEGQDNPYILTNQFSRNDYGLFARIDLLIPIYKNFQISLDISEEFGLKNLNTISTQQSLLGKMTTQSLSLGLGVVYSF